MKQIIRKLIPPIFFEMITKLRFSRYGWHGDFKSWEEAKKNTTSYESEEIIKKIRASALKVKRGEAVYERDGVIFNEIQYSWPLLAGLMYAAAKSGGILRVLDFGGSLGSTYFQNKKFLDGLKDVSWCIVEQKHFVKIGKSEFEDDRLKFYYDIETCIKNDKPNVLILSSVLQYLEKPYEILDSLLKNNFEYVIVDLTLVSKIKERILIQKVDPKIYNASYPCRVLNYNELNDVFIKNSYNLLEEFSSLNGFKIFSKGQLIGEYRGQIWEKK